MDKRIDVSDPMKPLPVFRFLVYYVPRLALPSLEGREYLIYGTDDPEIAEREAADPDRVVRENPRWRTLN